VRRWLKPDPRCPWQSHSSRVGANVGGESTESRSVVQKLRILSVIRPERRTSVVVINRTDDCCSAGTNDCLDSRQRAFALGGLVSAEWRRCPSPWHCVQETMWLQWHAEAPSLHTNFFMIHTEGIVPLTCKKCIWYWHTEWFEFLSLLRVSKRLPA